MLPEVRILIGPFKAPFLKRDSCVSLCVDVASWENSRVVIKLWSAHFVSLPAWHALHSVGEIVYDGVFNRLSVRLKEE